MPLAEALVGFIAGVAACALICSRVLERRRRSFEARLVEEKSRAEEEVRREAGARMAELAQLLFEKGCYDVYDRARMEAEALLRGADPETLAYFHCLMRCMKYGCSVDECLLELGFKPEEVRKRSRL